MKTYKTWIVSSEHSEVKLQAVEEPGRLSSFKGFVFDFRKEMFPVFSVNYTEADFTGVLTRLLRQNPVYTETTR